MITPPTSARGTLSNFEARGSARTESATDFRQEVARGRERVARREPDTEAEDAAVKDADAPTETRDVEPDARFEEHAARKDVSESATSAPRDDGARPTTRTEEAQVAPARARTATVAEPDAPLVATADAEASTATTAPLIATTTVDPIAVPDLASKSNARVVADVASDTTAAAPGALAAPAPAPATNVAHVGPDAAPVGSDVAGVDVAPPDLADAPRDARAVASSESSPNQALSAVSRGAPSIADVAPTSAAAPMTPPRLTPAEMPHFLDTLQVRVDAAASSALVELEPPDLGKLTVELVLQPEGGVRAEVRVERPDGYAAMEARLPELRASLVDRGFASAEVQLSLGLAQRDPRGDAENARSSRARRSAPRELESERVLALAPSNNASIDLWA